MFTQTGSIQRFVRAQDGRFYTGGSCVSYQQALRELRAGRKRSHWIWYIFPQREGLGFSATNRHYGIQDAAEARAYLSNVTLRDHLVEATQAVLDSQDRLNISGQTSIRQIFNGDQSKYWASITLFYEVAQDNDPEVAELMRRALQKGFNGVSHRQTLNWLRQFSEESEHSSHRLIKSTQSLSASSPSAPSLDTSTASEVNSIKQFSFFERLFQGIYGLFFGKEALRRFDEAIQRSVQESHRGRQFSVNLDCHWVWASLMGYSRVIKAFTLHFQRGALSGISHPPTKWSTGERGDKKHSLHRPHAQKNRSPDDGPASDRRPTKKFK